MARVAETESSNTLQINPPRPVRLCLLSLCSTSVVCTEGAGSSQVHNIDLKSLQCQWRLISGRALAETVYLDLSWEPCTITHNSCHGTRNRKEHLNRQTLLQERLSQTGHSSGASQQLYQSTDLLPETEFPAASWARFYSKNCANSTQNLLGQQQSYSWNPVCLPGPCQPPNWEHALTCTAGERKDHRLKSIILDPTVRHAIESNFMLQAGALSTCCETMGFLARRFWSGSPTNYL